MNLAAGQQAHAQLMDGVYRWQRHIYDLTRKYYLFGRDRMIRELAVPARGTVLEIGCGTGRNLAVIRRLWPEARLYGIDISAEMLKTAHARPGVNAVLALGDAAAFDADHLLGWLSFDRILMPYCTSMIPAWQEAIVNACGLLAPGGSLHIVDFGDLAGMPALLRVPLQRWLAAFHVTPRTDLAEFVTRTVSARGLACTIATGPGGYYQRLAISRPGLPDAAASNAAVTEMTRTRHTAAT
ncbi:MAG TPA: class I SAM-dependent methyltransferase [Novosphingobium sp.]|nr:class I SAM-dependent methyltransferase [Novosphingobium sp.]